MKKNKMITEAARSLRFKSGTKDSCPATPSQKFVRTAIRLEMPQPTSKVRGAVALDRRLGQRHR